MSIVPVLFYNKLLPHIPLEHVGDILDIESASGGSLPYIGYIRVDIQVSGAGVADTIFCLLLVAPDTQYTARVPILLGTNILSSMMKSCKKKHGARFYRLLSCILHGNCHLEV